LPVRGATVIASKHGVDELTRPRQLQVKLRNRNNLVIKIQKILGDIKLFRYFPFFIKSFFF